MSRRIVVNSSYSGELRIATVEGGTLENFDLESRRNPVLKGNIYKGVVERIDSSKDNVFVSYGAVKNGFLPGKKLYPHAYTQTPKNKKKVAIAEVLRVNDEILVQVEKDEIKTKGAKLTTELSLSSKYMVIYPYNQSIDVSKKIKHPKKVKKLFEEVLALSPPPGEMGFIIRTAAEGQSKEVLLRDYQSMLRIWGHVQASAHQLRGAGILHQEPGRLFQILRSERVDGLDGIYIDDAELFAQSQSFCEEQLPELLPLLIHYEEPEPIFQRYGVDKQIDALSSNQVDLPSGGNIVISPIEALTAVDVNSGSARGSRGTRDPRQLDFEVNCEAARVLARQLRLRSIGGLIVVDFIDMPSPGRRREVRSILKQAMEPDRALFKVGEISEFGLLELKREQHKGRLHAHTHAPCSHCGGTGTVLTTRAKLMSLLAKLHSKLAQLSRMQRSSSEVRLKVSAPADVIVELFNEERTSLTELEARFEIRIELAVSPGEALPEEPFELTGVTPSPRAALRRQRAGGTTRGSRRGSQTAVKALPSEGGDEGPVTPARRVGKISLERLAAQAREAIKESDEELTPLEKVSDEAQVEAEALQSEGSEADEGQERRRSRRRGRGRRRRGGRSDERLAEQSEAAETSETPAIKDPSLEEGGETLVPVEGEVAEESEAQTDPRERRRQAARDRNKQRSRRRRGERGEDQSGEETSAASPKEQESEERRPVQRNHRPSLLPAEEGSHLAALKTLGREILSRSKLRIPIDVERLKKSGSDAEAIEEARQIQRRFSRYKVALDALRIIAEREEGEREQIASTIEPLLRLDRWGKVREYFAKELGPFEDPERALYFKGTSERAFQSGPLQRLTKLEEGTSLLPLYPAELIEEISGERRERRPSRRRRGGRRRSTSAAQRGEEKKSSAEGSASQGEPGQGKARSNGTRRRRRTSRRPSPRAEG
ncbi:MAG: Rne/Rng family ribonuclease [Myxococcota bacterium]|nr:Rne/Rng family ribonuclease [Myxococcota bacterium]